MQGNISNKPKKLLYFLFIIICIFSSLESDAQKEEQLSYYNIEILQKANDYFNAEDYYNALSNYQKILKKAPDDTTVILRMAECYKMLNSFDESEEFYRKILHENIDVPVDAEHKLNFAQVLTINGKYNEALYWYKDYYLSNNSDLRAIAGINTIENLDKLYYDTLFYVVFPSNINTIYDEFSPVLYKGGVIFISDRPGVNVSQSDKGSNVEFTKWYLTEAEDDGSLHNPKEFSKEQNIKTYLNEGPVIFYDDYRKMIFTQNAEMKDDKDKVVVHPVQLYLTNKDIDGNWSESKVLSFCDNRYSYGQPAITSDGKKLVFSSDMPGGYGGADLYISRFENNTWQKPVNLGKKINSKGNEMFPYILNDSVLYFSSDGHGGLGGLDICHAPLSDTGHVINIGPPVNSSKDDFGIVFDEDGMSGYLSSNRKGSAGNDDIYVFRIVRISLVLKIIDQATSIPISNAEVFFVSGMDENLLGTTDDEGNCKVILPVSKEISIKVKKENFESQIITFEPVKYNSESTVLLHAENTINKKVEEVPITKTDTVIYKVQIMASRRSASSRQIKRKYKGNMPVSMSYEDKWHKYTIGEFETYQEACSCLKSSRVSDAFVVAYIDNKRVNIVLAKSKTNESELDICNPQGSK